jgi:Flp pilus assembly protein protease CpaA
MAAEDNILTWNVPNWITVVLMASIAFFAIGVAQKYIAKGKGGA